MPQKCFLKLSFDYIAIFKTRQTYQLHSLSLLIFISIPKTVLEIHYAYKRSHVQKHVFKTGLNFFTKFKHNIP